MTRTIIAAVLLSLTLGVLPAAAAAEGDATDGATADGATATVTDLNISTLRQAGWSWECIAQDFPTTTSGEVITVSFMHVGGLVIGVCPPTPQSLAELTDENQAPEQTTSHVAQLPRIPLPAPQAKLR